MLLRLFWTYLKVGTFTLGGGYAMLPLIQREVVDYRKWIDETEFLNMIALAQAAPGLIAVNSAIFIGHEVGSRNVPAAWSNTWRAAVYPYLAVAAAVFGAVLPSFVIILAIAMVFADYHHLPAVEAVMKGVRPAVVALIAAPLLRMTLKANNPKPFRDGGVLLLAWALAAAMLIWLANVSPVYIIVATILLALISTWLGERRRLHNKVNR
ncbi:MAG: chromate transporter [Paludibacteraceae bacterium]|nr:chromate transporter [Paludibacteraceae bacterium]